MSWSPFYYVEVFNHNKNKWEKIEVFTKRDGEFKEVDLWWANGTHELFSVLGFEESYDVPEFDAMHGGLPGNVSEGIKKDYDHFNSYRKENYPITNNEVKFFNLADALLYLKDNPKVKDENKMEEIWRAEDIEWDKVEKIYMTNPLKELVDRVYSYIEFGKEDFFWNNSASDVRVITFMFR